MSKPATKRARKESKAFATTASAAALVPQFVGDLIFQDPLVQSVCQSALSVYQVLGSGLNEALYCKAMEVELREKKIGFDPQYPIVQMYHGSFIGESYPDLVVDGKLVFEAKAIKGDLLEEHLRQLHHYLLQMNFKLGVLVNFGRRTEIDTSCLPVMILANVGFLLDRVKQSIGVNIGTSASTSMSTEGLEGLKSLHPDAWVCLCQKLRAPLKPQFRIHELVMAKDI